MKLFRAFSYPATPLLLLSAAYVLLRVQPGSRMHVFSVLLMTSIGVAEVILAISHVLQRRPARLVIAHALTAIGALLLGYAALNEALFVPFATGAVLFGVGALLWRLEVVGQTTKA
jgi:CHASE2 domain-containing sensor protein